MEELKLVRTDSTTVNWIPHLKRNGTNLTPMGRIRRLERWRNELIKEYKKTKK